jgi:hypothetical protein
MSALSTPEAETILTSLAAVFARKAFGFLQEEWLEARLAELRGAAVP